MKSDKARLERLKKALAKKPTNLSVEALNKALKGKPSATVIPAPKLIQGAPPKVIRNGKKNRLPAKASRPKVSRPLIVPIQITRPSSRYMTSLLNKVTRLSLPPGSFNAGLAKLPNSNKYICVFRPNELAFIGCILDKYFRVEQDSLFEFQMTNCADPRIIWLPDNRLLMTYSSIDDTNNSECIRGGIIMNLNVSSSFIQPKLFRISPDDLVRQKNWMPFICDDKIYLIGRIKPHTINELIISDEAVFCEKKYETDWISPWFYKEFFLRGNTNAIQMADGNFLSTFHTVVKFDQLHYYDNGCYVFEGKPPFKVLRCANRTYLRAEDAVEPHFRKKNQILVNFPVGMVREGEKLFISYGDNDSAVKIMETTVSDMVRTTIEVY